MRSRSSSSILFALAVACAPAPAKTIVPQCADKPSADTTVFDTTQVTRKPEILVFPRLTYPDELRRQHISGGVVYSMIVSAEGRSEPASIKVVHSDHPKFIEATRKFVEDARFSPGCLNGEAVRVRVAVPIDFSIRG